MRAGAVFAIIATVVIATRLCHSHVLWADDNLPLAAAIEIARGKTLYRDVWFDKPPLVAWIALLWGARAGVLLRLAGAAYVIATAAAAWQFARKKWSEREGLLAACFAALFLTFDLPSAIIPLASDMLLILPHFLAVYFAWRGRAFLSGAAAGIGLMCSSKALFVLAACALWQWRSLPLLLAGFAAPNALALGWMWAHGSAAEYYRQVWQWGSIYAANTFVEHPVTEGAKRTVDWIGFHAALVIGAIIAISNGRGSDTRAGRWRMAAWLAIAFAGVILGLRFFPRYYFLLLPPMTIAAAGGWGLLMNRHRGAGYPACGPGFQQVQPAESRPQARLPAPQNSVNRYLPTIALVVLLAIPVVRFAPHYVTVARNESWRDLDMDRDSQAAAEKLRALAQSGDTLFVWGFRPDIFIYSGLPAGTRFLESQPISGVLADRHLFSTASVAPEFTAPNREELTASHPTSYPTWLVDGLGAYNPSLALDHQTYLLPWLAHYKEVDRTNFSILYRLR
jgi:hypothetical protein